MKLMIQNQEFGTKRAEVLALDSEANGDEAA